MAESSSKEVGLPVSRRTALRALGAAAVAPALGKPLFGLPGYHPQVPALEEDRRWRPRFLDAGGLRTIEEVAELILPETDTPGARAALVHQYIDFVLSRQEGERDAIIRGLEWLERRSQAIGSVSFIELELAAQTELLARASRSGSGNEESGRAFFEAVKRLTIRGYYRSEIGMHAELGYEGNRYLREFPGCAHPEHHDWRPAGDATTSREKA